MYFRRIERFRCATGEKEEVEQQRAAGLGSASVGSSEAAELEEEVMNRVQQVR